MLKNIAIGTAVGFGVGCVLGALKTTVTLTCPVLWIPGTAGSLGSLAYGVSDGNIPLTVAATVVGAGLGTAELMAYPLTAPLSIAQAMCMPALGAVVGGIAGSGVLD